MLVDSHLHPPAFAARFAFALATAFLRVPCQADEAGSETTSLYDVSAATSRYVAPSSFIFASTKTAQFVASTIHSGNTRFIPML